jgi:two-component system cell cycle response regulator CtrA
MRILLVDDDSEVVKSLEMTLRAEGFTVDSTTTSEDGLEIAKLYDYDLIILDLMMPELDGYEILKRLRASRVETPVLCLSGLQDTQDKLRGFGLGADDYLTKPFDKAELLARIQAIIRRSKGHAGSVIQVGRLSVNLEARLAEVDNKPLELTSKEYAILELLVLRKGSTLSKVVFLNHLYGGMDEPELKIIDVFVCKLRKKLQEALGTKDENYIKTVWGRGYVFQDPGKQVASETLDIESTEGILGQPNAPKKQCTGI